MVKINPYCFIDCIISKEFKIGAVMNFENILSHLCTTLAKPETLAGLALFALAMYGNSKEEAAAQIVEAEAARIVEAEAARIVEAEAAQIAEAAAQTVEEEAAAKAEAASSKNRFFFTRNKVLTGVAVGLSTGAIVTGAIAGIGIAGAFLPPIAIALGIIAAISIFLLGIKDYVEQKHSANSRITASAIPTQ
jgi:hypothetical protein